MVKLKFDPLFKKGVPRYLLGTYRLNIPNKNNRQIKSKFLTFLNWFFIILFILTMITSMFLIGQTFYNKLTTKDKNKYMGVVLPSISKDDIKIMAVTKESKSPIVFIPILLFLPVILIITSLHEFGHYIMCRRHGVEVDNYGIGTINIICIPLLFYAFVNPKEEQFEKIPKSKYFGIISAGVGMNISFCLILFIISIIMAIFGVSFGLSTSENYFLYLLVLFNLGIGGFNSLPISILDGGLFVKKISRPVYVVCTSVLVTILGLLVII